MAGLKIEPLCKYSSIRLSCAYTNNTGMRYLGYIILFFGKEFA